MRHTIQNESRTVKWTPSLWPEDRKLLTWDTSCTCLLLSSLCWDSRHCQLHWHCVMKGQKLKLHYCVHVYVFTLLTAAITCLTDPLTAHLFHCFTDTDTNSEIKHDFAFQHLHPHCHGEKSKVYLEYITQSFNRILAVWWHHIYISRYSTYSYMIRASCNCMY